MHFNMIYKYALNRTLHKLIVYIVTILLCFLLFVLLLISIFANNYVGKGKKVLDKCLNGGVGQAGLIEIETFDFEYKDAINSFVQDANLLAEVRGIGYGCCFGGPADELEVLWERQKQLQKTSDDNLWLYFINLEAVNVCNMILQDGKLPDEYDFGKNTALLYLGSGYSDVPIGTTYETVLDDGRICLYYVAGIFEEGMNWISEDVYIDDLIVDAVYVENMDYQILVVDEGISSFRLTYTVEKGYKVKDVETKLRMLAEKHGLKMRFAVLEDILDEKERQHSYIFDTIKKMLIAITITAFLLLLCTQFAEMLDDMSYFGIFYANGASTRDLISILLGENLIKVIVSYILAVIAVYYAIKHEWSLFQPGIEKWENAMEIYCGQTIGPAFVIGVMLALLATVIPILWFRKKSPTELMRGYDV